ncbi:MAG TPA: hypothetical protein VNU70_05385 [Puia sp.]|jgi:hypothetical protein|nr:hypothetical protein [Puia sp.]
MLKLFIPLVLLLSACNGPNSYKKAQDPEEAGSEFIRAALDGNYEKASFYLYADSTNKVMFAKWKKDYDRMSAEERQKYQDASIRPIEIKKVNDSVSTYTYTNSYKNDTTTIRIIRSNGDWMVDLEEILYHHRR